MGVLFQHPLKCRIVLGGLHLRLEDMHELVDGSVVMFSGGTTPAMADAKLSPAQMSASAGVSVSIVRYLCLKNTELQVPLCLVSLM
jgi:hypothetical protein